MTGLDVAMEKGLPRAASQVRPRDTLNMLLFESIERTTTALRRGDDFSAQSIRDLEALIRRVNALELALVERLQILEDD